MFELIEQPEKYISLSCLEPGCTMKGWLITRTKPSVFLLNLQLDYFRPQLDCYYFSITFLFIDLIFQQNKKAHQTVDNIYNSQPEPNSTPTVEYKYLDSIGRKKSWNNSIDFFSFISPKMRTSFMSNLRNLANLLFLFLLRMCKHLVFRIFSQY